jgi:hypothetical protein
MLALDAHVAPVAAATESKCAPMMTTSSFSFGSVPGISAIRLNPFGVVSSWNSVWMFELHLHGMPFSRMRTIRL